MAFKRLEIKKKSNPNTGTGVKCGLRKNAKLGAQLNIVISDRARQDMGWSADQVVSVDLGTDEHHGLVRVHASVDGEGVKLTKRGADAKCYYVLNLGHVEEFVNRTEDSRWCNWDDTGETVDNETLHAAVYEIVLPQWADETRPGGKRVSGAPDKIPLTSKEALTPAHGKPYKPEAPVMRDVTSSVMGDPPPGRREMMDKIAGIKL